MEMHNFVKVHSTIAIARGIFQLCYGKLKVNIVKNNMELIQCQALVEKLWEDSQEWVAKF